MPALLALLLWLLAWPAWGDETVLIETCLLAEGQKLDVNKQITFVDSPTSKPGRLRASMIGGAESFNTTPDSLDCVLIYTYSNQTFYARVVDPKYKGLATFEVLRRIMDRQ